MNEIEMIELFYLVDDFSNRFHQMCFQNKWSRRKEKSAKKLLEDL